MKIALRQIEVLLIVCCASFYAQAITYKWGIRPRLDTAFDTRQSVGTDDGATILYPYPPEYDANGCDINAHAHFGMTPAVSRLFFKISDFKLKECELRAYLEGMYGGVIDSLGSSVNTVGLFSLRYAFIKAIWPQTTIIIGENDHPMYWSKCAPNTVNFNGGMPTACYTRGPQFRIERQWHEFIFGLTAYSQFLFQSMGPIGFSRTYIRHSCAPGLCLTALWRHRDLDVGLLFNVERLQPAVYTVSANDKTKKQATEERITSVIGSGWFGFNIKNLRINNQLIIGQNGPDFNTLGGYAISCYNETTGACTYTNINFASIWSDWEYGKYKTITPGFFIGVTKSLGAGKNPVYLNPTTHKPTFYGFDDDLDLVFRCAPRITTKFHDIFVGFEVDYSKAWFGPMNICGKHPCTCPVDSVRFLVQTHTEF